MKNTVLVISGLVTAYGLYNSFKPEAERKKMSPAQQSGSRIAVFVGALGLLYGFTALK
jgi:hypothetical protein